MNENNAYDIILAGVGDRGCFQSPLPYLWPH